jgi:murein tripeptide amidase MpaA
LMYHSAAKRVLGGSAAVEEVEARARERLAAKAGVRTAAEAESTRLREQVAALEKELAVVQLRLQLADSTHKAELEKAGVQKEAELRQAVELAEQHETQVIMGLERYPV